MMLTALLLSLGTAQAAIDEECLELANGELPEDYREADQEAYLLNYFSLATTFSPLHGPVPHKPGKGSVSLEASIIPPLPCERRLVLSYTKTEDTNKAPMMPRPRLAFSFNKLGPFVPYAGFGYVPPVTVFGTRNVIVSGEVGLGLPTESAWSFGARFHSTMMKTVAEIATPFEEGDEAKEDLYIGSTFGFDLMAGARLGEGWEPYMALGFTDVSTFFYIGDDDYVGNNTTPYAGLTSSVGVDIKVVKNLALAAEVYAAPYNFTRTHLDTGSENLTNVKLYTGRLRFGYRW
jgi:hypothetical protein